MSLIIMSPSFMHDRVIPARHTCDGLNISPPLAWTGVPVGTKSLSLIVDDPDAPDPAAPKMTWVHWVLYNLPPTLDGLPEAAGSAKSPTGALAGVNDWKRTRYGGPRCPAGRRTVLFKS